ncbi:MAG: nitroreductase family deazaflavin-dependent oxidoreductase [Deltaproteobacteria bacterium]|nr:nitroreductase family deazaflavin-dependent oxidoreductase [Deltaproteobacteria bacterium]
MSQRPYSKTEVRIANPLIKAMSRVNTWVYRATGGRLGGRFLRGAPVLLLTTVGRKSGAPRVAPLIYLRDGEHLVLVASKGGMDHHPLWYRNLVANPDVEVQLGRDVLPMRARTANDAERAALWPRLLEVYRDYADYQARTARQIPVVILSPRAS